MGQEVLTLKRPVLKYLANETSRIVSVPVAHRWPQKHRNQEYWTQQLSGSTHVISKRLFPLPAGNDVVSRNITMVLENLLKDYDSSQLPTHGKGKSLHVSLFSLF
jgi:gamma-aminobutyric acid receptor subunit alpha